MYKVLIIDDEEPVRQAIKILGDWEKLGIGIIMEAQDGVTGLELLREQNPDIILIDMKMPLMNGVEFLKISGKEYTDTLNIIISGYEDFEFTKQAIKSKAVDYLLKPVNRTELNDALSKAVSIIQDRRRTQSEITNKNIMLNVSLPTLREKIFISAIDGIYNEQILESHSELIDYIRGKKCFGVALLKIMNLEEINSKCFNGDVNLLYFALSNVINEISSHNLNCFSFRNPKVKNEIIGIITYESSYRDEVKFLSRDLIKHALITLKNLFGIMAVASIGRFNTELTKLGESYKHAELIMKTINLLNMNELVFCDVVNKGKTLSHPILSKDFIKSALEGGSLYYIQSIISEYMSDIKETGYFSLGDAHRALDEFVFMMNDIALEFGVPYDEIPPKDDEDDLNFSELSCGISEMADFERLLYFTLDHTYRKIKCYSKSYEEFDIYDIKDYIDKRYFEDINLSLFTEKYFFSREYLMKSFKKKFECGIYEYVLKVRMDRAKILLKDPEIKIQNISNMLGYKDNNYFSKAFKNYYGLTPSEYRSNVLKP